MLKLIPVCLCQLPSLNPFKTKRSIVLQQDGKVVTSTRVMTNLPGEIEKKRWTTFAFGLDLWKWRCHWQNENTLNKIKSFLRIKSSNCWPLLFTSTHPQKVWWQLKSTIKIKGDGSWSIRYWRSLGLKLKWLRGGKWTDHRVIVFWAVTLTATACRVVFNVVIFWGIFSLTRMETPPEALFSITWNVW